MTKQGKFPIDRPCSACSAGDYKMAYHNHEEPFREVAAASLPESQPSPSGDYEQLVDELFDFIGRVDPSHDNAVRWLRSHDAKVSEQAEQRLRALLKAAKSVCCDCSNGNVAKDIAGDWIHTGREHGSWSGEGKKFRRTCQLSLYLRSEITLAEAALQESPK